VFLIAKRRTAVRMGAEVPAESAPSGKLATRKVCVFKSANPTALARTVVAMDVEGPVVSVQSAIPVRMANALYVYRTVLVPNVERMVVEEAAGPVKTDSLAIKACV